jgi:hypothetical protein
MTAVMGSYSNIVAVVDYGKLYDIELFGQI